MSVYKLYAKEVRGQENLVYIYLYKLNTGDKQPVLSSLKIKIPKKCCLPSIKDFKKVSKELSKYKDILLNTGFENVDTLNNFLEERLETFQRNNGRKPTISLDKRSLNEWILILINRQTNQGTKLRYTTINNLIIQFQQWYSVNKLKRQRTSTILMKDIDIDYILDFKKWLLTEPNEGEKRKKNSLYTANYKLKCLKAMLNKSHSQEYFTYVVNPFNHITFENIEPKIDILTMKELKSLITTQFVEVYRRTIPNNEGEKLWGTAIEGGVENRSNSRYKAKHTLNDVRNYFLFQLLSQGIRVSDLATLRWHNFEYYDEVMRINKRMVKTKSNITILVNEKMTGLISHYIVRYEKEAPELVSKIKTINEKIVDIYNYINGIDFKAILSLNDTDMSKCIKAVYLMSNSSNFTRYYTHAGFIISQKLINELEIYLYDNINDFDILMKSKPQRPSIIPIKYTTENKIDEIINTLNKWLINQRTIQYQKETDKYIKLKAKRNVFVIDLIHIIKKTIYKDDFVFTLLRNEDFKDIVKEDFSRLSEEQYRKFQSFRAYYNKLLKLVSTQANINKNLTSHIARHSYASLMLELGENINLFDLMTSLGHQKLNTTQSYLQRLSNKKIDKLNKVISDSLNTGININI